MPGSCMPAAAGSTCQVPARMPPATLRSSSSSSSSRRHARQQPFLATSYCPHQQVRNGLGCRVRRCVHTRAQSAPGPTDSSSQSSPDPAKGDDKAREQEKIEKINAGQYLFYKVKEKAEQKVERTLNRARLRYLDNEKKALYHEETDPYQSSKLLVSSPVLLLKHGVWSAIMFLMRLPLTYMLRAVVTVDAWWKDKFSTRKFDSFLMAEGEKIWGWKNRTENERWFWQYFFFRVLLPTVGGIFTYEAFVPNNFLWAVVVPYIFYWAVYGIVLNPWIFDWWLVMYLGLYAKCWPDVVACLQWMLFIR